MSDAQLRVLVVAIGIGAACAFTSPWVSAGFSVCMTIASLLVFGRSGR